MSKLSLIAAMALGGLVAFSTLATAQDASTNGNNGGKHRSATVEQQLDRLSTKLNLTDDQKPKVKAVLEDQQAKMKDIHSDTSLDKSARREKMQTLHKDVMAKMKGILTEDQFTTYQAMSQHHGKKKSE